MSHAGTGYDINQTFIIEPLFVTGGSPTMSACTALYSNALVSCSGNTNIILGDGIISFNGNLYTNDSITANTINASFLYSGGTNVFDIFSNLEITGGTLQNEVLTLVKKDNSSINITGFTDFYTTGATIIGNTIYFDRNDELSAYTVSLDSVLSDIYVTGVTFDNNKLLIVRNDGVKLDVCINTFTGLTINGSLAASSISANTISATTFYGDGSKLTGLVTIDTYVTGGTYSNGTTIFENNSGGTFSVNGFFKTSDDIYTSGVTFNPSNYNLMINRNDGQVLMANLSVLASDVTITGGTYNPITGIATFENNTGGTFNITGFLTGYTDTTISAFTYNNANTFKIDDTKGNSFYASINTVSGLTINGILSASTYFNLPLDIRVTGGTVNRVGNLTNFIFTNNTGGTYSVNSVFDTFVTGGTYANGTTIFTNNSGTTFAINGYYTGNTDVYVTGGTYSNGNIIFTNNTGGTFNVNGLISTYITGFTYDNSNNLILTSSNGNQLITNISVFSGLTATTINGNNILSGGTDLSNIFATISGLNTISNSLSAYTTLNLFNTYTGATNTTINTLNSSLATKAALSGASFTGAISAPTISATTYLNLPLDIRVTGGTYNNGMLAFTNNAGGTFNVTGLYTGYTPNQDIFVTGGTKTGSNVTFTNNSGGTFNVNGFTDVYTTGGTYSNGSTTFTNNTGGTFNVNGYYTGSTDVFVSGATTNNVSRNYTFTNTTGGTFSIFGLLDVTITGGTYSNGGLVLTNSTGGTTTINGFYTGYTPTQDIFVTGGTKSNTNVVFTNNSGGTFTVTGFIDTFVTGGTYTNGTTVFTNSTGGTFSVNGYYTGYTAPIDIRVTGGTYNAGTAVFTNNTGGTFNVTGLYTGTTDVYTTGATTNNATRNYTFTNSTGGTFSVFGLLDVVTTGGTYSNGNIQFTNSTGGTFNVNGLYTGATDIFTTGGTKTGSNVTFTNNSGGTFTVSGFSDVYTTGGTYSNGIATLTNSTGGTFNITGFSTGSTTSLAVNTTPITNGTSGSLLLQSGSTLVEDSNLFWDLTNKNLAIGSNSFDSTNPEKLKISASTGSTSVNLLGAYGNLNSYLQLYIQNTSTGNTASSDFVATSDNGNQNDGYIDFGINNSNFSSGSWGNQNDGYLYISKTGATGGNLVIGTNTGGKAIYFYTSGGTSAQERLRITDTGISATTISGNTYYSGGTLLSTAISNIISTSTPPAINLGATIFVSSTGSDLTGVRYNLSQPFKTITAALTGATTGDTIFVFAGTYTETGLFKDGVNYYFANGAIISPTGTTSIFTVTNPGKDFSVDGFLTINSAQNGCAFDIRNNSNNINYYLKFKSITMTNVTGFDTFGGAGNTARTAVRFITEQGNANVFGDIKITSTLNTQNSGGLAMVADNVNLYYNGNITMTSTSNAYFSFTSASPNRTIIGNFTSAGATGTVYLNNDRAYTNINGVVSNSSYAAGVFALNSNLAYLGGMNFNGTIQGNVWLQGNTNNSQNINGAINAAINAASYIRLSSGNNNLNLSMYNSGFYIDGGVNVISGNIVWASNGNISNVGALYHGGGTTFFKANSTSFTGRNWSPNSVTGGLLRICKDSNLYLSSINAAAADLNPGITVSGGTLLVEGVVSYSQPVVNAGTGLSIIKFVSGNLTLDGARLINYQTGATANSIYATTALQPIKIYNNSWGNVAISGTTTNPVTTGGVITTYAGITE